MTNTLNIVHEADAQRQHVRVNLPASIIINDTEFQSKDWSNAGMSVLTSSKKDFDTFKDNEKYDSVLQFGLDSFALQVPMTVQVVNTNANDNIVGVRFIEMTERQISIMQHLVNAYVTGDITNVNDLIHVVGRNNMSSPRKIPTKEDNTLDRFGGFVRRSLVFLASLVLLAYIGIAIYDQKFVVEATSATIQADSFPLTAPSSGIVGYKNIESGNKVSKGEALITILSNTGTVTSADSPCNCIVANQVVSKGSVVGKNDPVLMLVPQNAPVYVSAYVSYDEALKIEKNQEVMISLSGGTKTMPATIKKIHLQSPSDERVKVTLTPTQNISNDMIGMPVEVRIDTLGWAF